MFGEPFGMGNRDGVPFPVCFNDVPRAPTKTESSPLADGVKPRAAVGAEYRAGCGLEDLTRLLAEVVVDEIVKGDSAEETNALAVGAVGAGEPVAPSLLAHLRLGQIADGEEGARHLVLAHLA